MLHILSFLPIDIICRLRCVLATTSWLSGLSWRFQEFAKIHSLSPTLPFDTIALVSDSFVIGTSNPLYFECSFTGMVCYRTYSSPYPTIHVLNSVTKECVTLPLFCLEICCRKILGFYFKNHTFNWSRELLT
ncbi:hypothetical protein AMTRI_Chr08g167410 [Amborella trichopoda]